MYWTFVQVRKNASINLNDIKINVRNVHKTLGILGSIANNFYASIIGTCIYSV